MATTITKPSGASKLQDALRSNATTTTSGTVPAGFFVAGFENTGAAAVTVDEQSIPAGGSMTLPYVGKQYGQTVSYDATGSTLLIKVIW